MLSYNIIPKPNYYLHGDSSYSVSSETRVMCHEDFISAANIVTSYLKTKTTASEGLIKISKTEGISPEGYELKITNDGVIINASDFAGALYACITFKTILMQATKKDGCAELQTLVIKDSPEYKHRGVMLDCSRNFFDKKEILKLLDNMLFLKLNRFHWHLSDDQGFRIECESFPFLNTVGSKRSSKHLKGFGLENDNVELNAFFTKDDIKEIVDYAAARNIEVIPEIDIPGHTMAILASYPELSCTNEKREVMTKNGISDAILCAGDDAVYSFLETLFDEICPLFPSKYFHIGGDEAFRGYLIWRKCDKCQAVMKEKGFKKEKELQVYFMNKVYEILKKHGKSPIAWDDCAYDGLDKNIACQFWRPHAFTKVINQAKKRDTILCPTNYFYFDLKYSLLPLKKTYKFNQYKYGFKDGKHRILGLECEIWTEFIDDKASLEFALYPRVDAFSEVAWTQLKYRNYKDFYKRLAWYKTYMQHNGINYSRLEKRFSPKKAFPYHLGRDGEEYKLSEQLKEKEMNK